MYLLILITGLMNQWRNSKWVIIRLIVHHAINVTGEMTLPCTMKSTMITFAIIVLKSYKQNDKKLLMQKKEIVDMDFGKEYVIRMCPELTEAEVNVVIDEVLIRYKSDEVYPQMVRFIAKELYPYIIRNDSRVYFLDGRQYIEHAILLLSHANAELDKMRGQSDDVARTQIDIKSSIHYLTEELDYIVGDDDVAN